MSEGVVGERAVGVHAIRDDLGDRIGLHHVDPFEGRHEGLLGRRQRRRDGSDPDVAAGLGRRLVHAGAQAGQRPLTAGGYAGGILRILGGPAIPRMPVLWLQPPVVEPQDQLAGRRNADAHQVGPCRHERGGVVGSGLHGGSRERQPEPRPRRVAQDVEELQAGGPVRIEPLEGPGGQPGRLRLGGGAAVGLGQELGLEREVDGPAGDVEGQLLGRDVVLAKRHDEGQGDPRGEPGGRPADVAFDHGRGEGDPATVQAADPEEAQHGPLAGGRRGCPGPGAPRAGKVIGAAEDRLEALGRAAGWLAHPVGVCAGGGPLMRPGPFGRRARSRRGRRRSAPPSRSARAPSSRPSRSGRHRRQRRGGARRRR